MRYINPDFIVTNVARIRRTKDKKLEFDTYLSMPEYYAEAETPLPKSLKNFIDMCEQEHDIIGIDISEVTIKVLVTIKEEDENA